VNVIRASSSGIFSIWSMAITILSSGTHSLGRVAYGKTFGDAVVPVGDVLVVGQHGPDAGPRCFLRSLYFDIPHLITHPLLVTCFS